VTGPRIATMTLFAALQMFVSAPVLAQWAVASPAGDTLRFGYLLQARGEWQSEPGASTAQNLFLRHLRLLAAGRVRQSISFFVGTDTPNMGKAQPDGTKNNGTLGVYDFWLTYEPRDAFKVDLGLIGTPISHNSIQSISGMLSAEFGPYSFMSSTPTGSKAGRDYGVQTRGYVLGRRVEYRGGAFQGLRGTAADHELRYSARVVVDPFGAEKSVYYSGTTLGARRSLALGVSMDRQERYRAAGIDLYLDQPLPNGDVIAAQGDLVRYDGGRTLPDLPRQSTWLAEVGYVSITTRLAPFVQFATQRFHSDSLGDHWQELVGLAFFAHGHKLNIKVGAGRARISAARPARFFQLTFQSFEL
jgi:hypothetical protein